jgi:sugar-specific transcriptional regulator TrmB
LIEESIQEIERSLKESFKLSSYEARAYMSLLRLDKQTSKQLSQTADVPLPRIYDTLESLMSKGFVVSQEDNFSAIPARQALRGRSSQFETQFIEEQKRRKIMEEQLITALQQSAPATASSKDSNSEISILKGFNTIANKFAEILENSHDVLLVAKRAVDAREFFIPILLEFSTGTKEKGKKRLRIITPKTTKIARKELEEAERSGTEIRRSDNVIFDMMITDTDDVLIGVPDPLSEEINHAIGIWVRNPSFARSTRSSLEEMWKYAERV